MASKTTMLRCLVAAITSASAMATAPVFAETIETIVVTSQARQQTAEEVPIAIQVVTMEQIAELGAANLSDMNGYFPGFNVSGQQATQPNYSLRGIGTTDFGIGTDAPVGVYVDGVYTGKTGGALMNFNDIQRVEVLKGPQGTLFGRNSAAGAIAIYTNDPSQNTDAKGHLRVGRFNTRYFDGMANTPLTDTTALRFSFVNSRSDGWETNTTTNKKVGGDNAFGTRLALKWEPSDAFSSILSWEHEDLDQTARPAFGVVKVPAGTRPPVPAVAANFVNPITAPLENDAPSSETRKFDGATLRIEVPIGDITFNSTTAYRHFKSFNQQDNDGTANILTYLDTINAETNTSWQQEFRLAAENDLLDWVAGVSFFHSKSTQQSDVNVYTDSIDTLVANQAGIDIATPYAQAFDNGLLSQNLYGNRWTEIMRNNNTAKAASLYGDVIWHLASAVNLTTGLRYTRDTKSATWRVPPRSAPGLDPFASELASAATLLNGAFPGLGDPLLAQNLVFADAAVAAQSTSSASHTWNDLSPRAVLDYRWSPDTMLFASISRGYQAGGYNVFVPGGRFDPEHMTNYEIGVKNYFPDTGLTLNASVFHYRFTNLQDIQLSQTSSGVPVYVINNSDQSATGVDFDGAFKLSDDVRLFAAAEYISQHYDKKIFTSNYRTDANGDTLQLDLQHQPVGTPLLTLMTGINVGWDLLDGRTDLTLQGTYTSEARCNDKIREEYGCLDDSPAKTGRATTRVDAKLGWERTDHRFGVALIVNNLFDKRYLLSPPNGGSALGGQSAFTLGTPYADSISPPRFWGLEFTAGL
jgi:iron complex outermembrane receptor protein